jgi:hypothetical protein
MAKMNWNKVQQQTKMLRDDPRPNKQPNSPKMQEILDQWYLETYGCNRGEISREEAQRRLDAQTKPLVVQRKPKKPTKPKNPNQQQLPIQVGSYRQCAASTKSGSRCRGGAQKGHDLCGPHLIQAAHDHSSW